MSSPTKSSYSWPLLLAGILSSSSRIISSHPLHFLLLSLLFLLPLSSLLISSPSLLPQTQILSSSSLLLLLLLLLPLSSAALSSLTLSTLNSFHSRPLLLLPLLQSLLLPILRLLSTSLSLLLIFSSLLALILSLSLLLLLLLSSLHVHSTSIPPYPFAAFISSLTIARLALEWCLAGVVAITESSWGFAPLRRSGELIDGMRLAAICVWAVFVAGVGLTMWGFGMWEVPRGGGFGAVVGRTAVGSALIGMLLLYVVVTHAVLYLYCKAVHGELIGEIVEEFASEYVTLPFDDRVPHVVSVILR